ncbi:MAG TPA: hypothetical protein VML96_05045 [Egibacteraceae bacterium]|nr:hypothetical protein [Egibacteraceae bacterium]
MIPEGQPQLSVQTGSFEMLAGDDKQVTFGVLDAEGPIDGADVHVWLRDLEGAVLAGPQEATFFDAAEIGGIGMYAARFDLPPGRSELVAAVGDAFGASVLNVATPETSALLAPGDAAPPAPTPTVGDDLGYEAVCTQDPPCGMHEVSLDDALAAGRPAVVVFATPAYCQTAVCGPVVETVDQVRRDFDGGEAAWIHVEIYRDAGRTLADAVQSWELPTEPWLFTVGADGIIVDRMDGPMLPDAVEELVSEIV